MLVAVDDDRSGLFGRAELHHLASERLGHLLVGGVVFARLGLVVIDPFAGLRIEDLGAGGKGQRRADHGHGNRCAQAGNNTAAGDGATGFRRGRPTSEGKDHGRFLCRYFDQALSRS